MVFDAPSSDFRDIIQYLYSGRPTKSFWNLNDQTVVFTLKSSFCPRIQSNHDGNGFRKVIFSRSTCTYYEDCVHEACKQAKESNLWNPSSTASTIPAHFLDSFVQKFSEYSYYFNEYTAGPAK